MVDEPAIADGRLHPSNQAPVRPQRHDGRATAGFLTANIHVGASRTLWRGVIDAAAAHDVNLICFPGGGLHVTEGFEAQRNVIYDLIDTTRLDGLLSWSSTVGGRLSPDEITNFHRRYRPLPLVSLTQLMPGSPTVGVDSYQGMRAAMIHLIEVHGYRRIAFVRGPEEHYHAQERYRAYTDLLQAYDVPVVPELITPPLPWGAGEAAIQMLLDDRGLWPKVDIEAIVTVSDLTALAMLRALQARGIQAPAELAIVGFNDSTEGRLAPLPLTSVAMPFYEQGSQALATLLAQLGGQEVPEQLMLQSSLVVRQSCGCPSPAVAHAAAGPIEAREQDLPAVFAELRDCFLNAPTYTQGDAGVTAQGVAQILDALHTDLSGRTHGLYLATLLRTLENTLITDGDFAAWQDIVSALRRALLPYLDHQARQRLEDMIGQARVLIAEAGQRADAFRQLQAERQSEILREIGQALLTAFDLDSLAAVLAARLPDLGIKSCYLSLYENAPAIEWSRQILAYTEQGPVALEPGGRRFPSRELAPRGLLPTHRRFSMVVEPLSFCEEQIGFVLLEIGPRDPDVYEILRGYISNALKGALLVQEIQHARLAAEKADRIKTRLLANVSHELRTPLHIILGNTRDALSSSDRYGLTLPQALLNDIQHIQSSAEHQLRLINDLLDLSRAEIDELDLYPELLDPRPLLEEAFHSLTDRAPASQHVCWRLDLPDRLSWIYADAVRLRQIWLNLLSNARKFTRSGSITLGAEVSPAHLHVWVEDTGIGIPADQQERIFEPFVTTEHDAARPSGIGLGLSITRRLVALHRGTMALNSRPGGGSTFHVYLPLPSLADQMAVPPAQAAPVLLVVSTSEQLVDEIVEFGRRQDLAIHHLRADEDLESVLARVRPAALAWDLAGASAGDWAIVRRLRTHPRWSHLPFILYRHKREDESTASVVGVTSFIAKPASAQTLFDVVSASYPARSSGPILIVDDDPSARRLHQDIVARALPGYSTRVVDDGLAALALMADETPSLVILDLIMPGMEGTDVIERMRADQRLRRIPVVIMSNKLLSLDDVKRLEQYAHVTLHSKGILSEEEMGAALNRALFDTDTLPPYTSALVKRAVAYLHQHYARSISRWELAQEVGVSEDYLSRVFNQELGLSPWEYLNRYRIYHAKELLRHTDDSISSVARQVGFQDQRYFSRVFRKLTGVGPREFRERTAAL
jgi:signal transduction histidine kinase/DNA-binding LacI/PurR family transcriptional regulator/AraC-like DNA-binding protein/DNA-binding response OmpR family regulator